MKIKMFLTFCMALLSSQTFCQTNTNDVLFTVDNEDVFASEFIRVFNKNLDLVKDESQKDVDEYLKLFVNYKLKLKEAKSLELDKKQTYIRELSNYRKQLAKNYTTDSKVTDKLVSEAYDRLSNEVKASHILIRLNEGAEPQDTLIAYNQLVNLRNRVLSEGYKKVQNEVHNGKTIFAEDLGYFSGFKMVYEFENVAYSTKIGDVSQPFRTQFGYHIVQVYEKRKSKGERTVSHIMISSNEKDSLQENPQTRINDIYKKINQGEDFESLAKQFSEDNSSAKKGGKLAPFSGGQLTSIEFEEVAFGLQKEGDISQPFKTAFGWHIVKLYGKKPIESFEIMKPELEARVKKDKRSQLINTSHVNSLIEKYNINTSIQPALDYFETVLNSDYFSGKWTLPENFDGNKPLIKIENSQLMYSDFANFIVTSQRRSSPKKTLKELTKVLYDSFLGSQLVQYQEDNLESENEDFANIMGEYRDGLLLFDLMDSEIWSAAKTDSVAIQEFYDEHKQDYYWNERIDAVVASSAKQSILKKTAKLLDKGKTQDQIKQELNTKNKINVIFSSGLMSANHQALPRNFKFKKGLSGIHKLNDAFVIVKVNEIQPKTIKSLEESKGKVISDYQEQKEVNWIKKLKEKYPVVVNEDVLNKVRNQINN